MVDHYFPLKKAQIREPSPVVIHFFQKTKRDSLLGLLRRWWKLPHEPPQNIMQLPRQMLSIRL